MQTARKGVPPPTRKRTFAQISAPAVQSPQRKRAFVPKNNMPSIAPPESSSEEEEEEEEEGEGEGEDGGEEDRLVGGEGEEAEMNEVVGALTEGRRPQITARKSISRFGVKGNGNGNGKGGKGEERRARKSIFQNVASIEPATTKQYFKADARSKKGPARGPSPPKRPRASNKQSTSKGGARAADEGVEDLDSPPTFEQFRALKSLGTAMRLDPEEEEEDELPLFLRRGSCVWVYYSVEGRKYGGKEEVGLGRITDMRMPARQKTEGVVEAEAEETWIEVEWFYKPSDLEYFKSEIRIPLGRSTGL
ncbi:hypothetical protein BT69DRAFT_593462 [Atractiella rhizophila]|nr:hypothetical protein BT69DRAFT_593462 [Atractiella rhizophila]